MQPDEFKKIVSQGIPDKLPEIRDYDTSVSHAPVRQDILTREEKKLAVRNALRYFDKKHHAILAPEFAKELKGLRTYLHVPFSPRL